MITVTETTAPGGFTDLRVGGLQILDQDGQVATELPAVELDVKQAAELFAALGKVLGGLARERSDEYEQKDLAGEEGPGDFLQIGTEDAGSLLDGKGYLCVNDGECVWFDPDQATATAAALIFHAAGS